MKRQNQMRQMLPQDIAAEQSVLGAMLLDRGAIEKAMARLKPEDFYRPDDQIIFSAIVDLYKQDLQPDAISLAKLLRERDQLDKIGGIKELTVLENLIPTSAMVEHHAGIVAEMALRRRTIKACQEIARKSCRETEDIRETLTKAEEAIGEIANGRTETALEGIGTITDRTLDSICQKFDADNPFTGLATGFKDFDELTSGLQPSDFIILAARPSMGKTSFALNILENVAIRKDGSVACFSLEMSKEQLVQRLLSSQTGIDSVKLRNGRMEGTELQKIINTADGFRDKKILIDDRAGITVGEMKETAKKWKKAHGLDLIIIDYLQLIQGENPRNQNRFLEIGEISRSIKMMARELDVPVLALSQLSRSLEMRTNKRPTLSDLRDSGALEQDADVISFIYRDDYYYPDSEKKNIAEIIVQKQRNGPTGTANLFFRKDITKFYNLDCKERSQEDADHGQ